MTLKQSISAKARCTPEWRAQHSARITGTKHTEEHNKKISVGGKGRVVSEEAKRKISIARTGKRHSAETRLKISTSNTGNFVGEKNPFFGKKHTPETIDSLKHPKTSEHRKHLSESCMGRKLSEETIQKIRLANSGKRCYLWKGGVSFEPYCPKFNNGFKDRVRRFFGYVCVECGITPTTHKLCVHHVNFDKMSCCNDTIPLFVPLCRSCHTRTQSDRPYWEQHFTDIINTKYNGKCYLTKQEVN